MLVQGAHVIHLTSASYILCVVSMEFNKESQLRTIDDSRASYQPAIEDESALVLRDVLMRCALCALCAVLAQQCLQNSDLRRSIQGN